MAVQFGATALQNLKSFRATKWFSKEFIKLSTRIASDYSGRNEVLWGGLVSDGSGFGSTNFDFNISVGEAMIGGIMMDLGVTTNGNLATRNTGDDILAPIWSDGTKGSTGLSGIDASSHDFQGTIIAMNSAGNGQNLSVTPDGTDAQYLMIIAGSSASALGTDTLTSAEITAALALSEGNGSNADHSLTNALAVNFGWVRLADFSTVSGTETIVANRNNHAGL